MNRIGAPLKLRPLFPFVASLIFALQAQAVMTMTFKGSHVQVAGVTKTGSVALISVMREAGRYMINRLTNTEQMLTDDDGDSIVDFDLGRPVPDRSLWAAVDVTSGESIVSAPGDYPRTEIAVRPNFVKKADKDDQDDSLVADHMIVHVLWVRPGKKGGAWFTRAADGGANDVDGRNDGKTETTAAMFAPLGNSGKAPKKLSKDDVIILLDPFAVNFSRITVTK